MRVLVTGADGFIGSHLSEMLQRNGHVVEQCGRANCGAVELVVDWTPFLGGVDAVVHLANTAHAYASPAELFRVNVDATERLAQQTAARGIRRFVYLSSVKVLGEETNGQPFDENSPIAPEDAYGRSKAEAERVLAQIAGLDAIVLRPPLTYGPRVQANFLRLIRAIDRGLPLPFGMVRNRRSFIHVGSLCAAIGRCLEAPPAGKQTWLVSDDVTVSTPQLCKAIAASLGKPARFFNVPPAILRLAPSLRKVVASLEIDSSAIRRELNWHSRCSIEDGLGETARWWRQARGRTD